MRLLVLGGTVFLGRHVVEAAVARRHDVVLFNRGRSNAQLFPDLEKLRGDRNGDLRALRGRRFDAVIDLSGYRPEHVRAVADVLGSSIAHYTFISSISVYREFPPGRTLDEEGRLAEGAEEYGPLKARCEEALEELIPGRLAHVRPGLIVGPHDPTDRFTYWPRRVARGGHVLAPGRPERPIQFIDVRDLAAWCVRLGEDRTRGVFNAIGPGSSLTMAQLLDECRAVSCSDARFAWVRDEDLLAADVQPWSELPLWIPEDDPHFGGIMLADNGRAVAAGLTFRPAADTIQATLEWERREGAPEGAPMRNTALSPEREREILARFGSR